MLHFGLGAVSSITGEGGCPPDVFHLEIFADLPGK